MPAHAKNTGNPMPAKTLQSRSVKAICMGGSNTTHSQKPQRQQTQPQNPGNVNISASLPCCNASRRAQCSHRAAAAGRALRVLQTLRSLSLKPQRPPTPPLPPSTHTHIHLMHSTPTLCHCHCCRCCLRRHCWLHCCCCHRLAAFPLACLIAQSSERTAGSLLRHQTP